MRRALFTCLAALSLTACGTAPIYDTVTAIGDPHEVGPKCPVAHVRVASSEMIGFVRLYFVPAPQSEQAVKDVAEANGRMGRWALFNAAPMEVGPGLHADGTLTLPAAWCAQGGAAFVAVDPLHPGAADVSFDWGDD